VNHAGVPATLDVRMDRSSTYVFFEESGISMTRERYRIVRIGAKEKRRGLRLLDRMANAFRAFFLADL